MRSRWMMVVISGGKTSRRSRARKRPENALDVGGILDGAGHKLDGKRRREGLAERRK